jgi:hypothetical protein
MGDGAPSSIAGTERRKQNPRGLAVDRGDEFARPCSAKGRLLRTQIERARLSAPCKRMLEWKNEQYDFGHHSFAIRVLPDDRCRPSRNLRLVQSPHRRTHLGLSRHMFGDNHRSRDWSARKAAN